MTGAIAAAASTWAAVAGSAVIAWSLLRIAEFVLSERNTARLLAAGGVERCDAQHLPLLLVNAAVPGLAIVGAFLPGRAPIEASVVALAAAAAAEGVHWWAILALASRWTTRVVVLPGERPSRAGPYRWFTHPGYVAGGLSGSLLPLIAGTWLGSVLAAVLLGAVVFRRVRCEGEAWRAIGAAPLDR